MTAALFAVVAIVAAIVIGHLTFRRFGSASDTVFNVWRVVFAISWILSGVALIVGGYTVFGAVLIALFWFVAAGGVSDLQEDMDVGSWRRYLSR